MFKIYRKNRDLYKHIKKMPKNCAYWRRAEKNKEKNLILIWHIYIVALIVFVVIKFDGSFGSLLDRVESYGTAGAYNCNIVPLKSIGAQVKNINERWALKNLLGNIIPFVPFGILLPTIYKKVNSFFSVFITGILFVFIIEIFQMVTKLGSFDIDDILLNNFGIIFGYTFYLIVKYFYFRRKN